MMSIVADPPQAAEQMAPKNDTVLPEAKASNLPRSDIERIADKVRKVVGYQPGDELIPIIKRIGGQVEFIDLHKWLDDHCATIEVRGKRDFAIRLSRVGGLLRNRFSLAHELGHYVLHSQLGKIPLSATRSLCQRWDDFIGPSMDIGFRLKDFASPRRIAVSIELAYLLASAKDHDDDGDFELHLADAIPLKGVINRKPYPAFWIESKGSGEDDDLASLERPLRSPARRHEIRAYCQAFIRMHSPPLFLPFIEKDPDFCTKPDGYASDLEDISKTWREFTSGEEPKSDQDAGPPQPINERLDELDELETSSD